MNVTIVAVICATAAGPAGPTQFCHEEILTRAATSIGECVNSWAQIADWKMKSRYASDDYKIARIRCIPGTYEKRDAL